MAIPNEDMIASVLEQIRRSPEPISSREIKGDEEAVLLAIKHLRWRGLIDGAFLPDSTRIPDQYGDFIYDAANLVAR